MSSFFLSLFKLKFLIFTFCMLTTFCFVVLCNPIVTSICNKTKFPHFCKTTLNSDPRIDEAHIYDIGIISIDLTSESATTSITQITRRIENIKYVENLHHFKVCKAKYEEVLENMFKARSMWEALDHFSVKNEVEISTRALRQCEQQFKSGEDPFGMYTTNLTKLLQIIEMVCNVALASMDENDY